jgi:hypothetical protein
MKLMKIRWTMQAAVTRRVVTRRTGNHPMNPAAQLDDSGPLQQGERGYGTLQSGLLGSPYRY